MVISFNFVWVYICVILKFFFPHQLLPAVWCKTRSFSNASEPLTQAQGRYMVTLIPGDGVGPELVYSVKRIFR